MPGEEKLIKKIFHAEILTLDSQFCTTSLLLFPTASGRATGLFMTQFKEKQNILRFILGRCQRPCTLNRLIIARLMNYEL